jgi:hypothetical protein
MAEHTRIDDNFPGLMFLKELGYSVSARGGDWQSATLARRTDDGYLLFADADEQCVVLSTVCGLFKVSSGSLQHCHPRFMWFEEQLLNLARYGSMPDGKIRNKLPGT